MARAEHQKRCATALGGKLQAPQGPFRHVVEPGKHRRAYLRTQRLLACPQAVLGPVRAHQYES
jgi:hypothetical protein